MQLEDSLIKNNSNHQSFRTTVFSLRPNTNLSAQVKVLQSVIFDANCPETFLITWTAFNRFVDKCRSIAKMLNKLPETCRAEGHAWVLLSVCRVFSLSAYYVNNYSSLFMLHLITFVPSLSLPGPEPTLSLCHCLLQLFCHFTVLYII